MATRTERIIGDIILIDTVFTEGELMVEFNGEKFIMVSDHTIQIGSGPISRDVVLKQLIRVEQVEVVIKVE